VNKLQSGQSFFLSALALLATSAAIMPAEAAALADLTCRLSMPTTLSRKEPAVAVLALRNKGKLPVSILKRNTPLEGWLADSLIVTRDGQPVAYSGAMAKRMPPTAEEYLPVKPGARRRFRVLLQRGYDVSLPGKYELRWKGELMDVQIGKTPVNPALAQSQTIACNTLSFTRSP
jgi:peptidyl-Lys metalloendopeptidase